jgi:hypothetical protein
MNTIMDYDNKQEMSFNHTGNINWPSYERFSETRNLLYNNYHHFIMSLDKNEVVERLSKLIQAQSISDGGFEKLLRRIEKWNKVQAPIPLRYVEFIGLKPVSVVTTAKADMRNFKSAMSCNLFTDAFYVQTETGLTRISLQELTPEKEAVSIVQRYKHPAPMKARYLIFKDLKTVIFEPSGGFYTLTWPPVLVLRNELFIPALIRHEAINIQI